MAISEMSRTGKGASLALELESALLQRDIAAGFRLLDEAFPAGEDPGEAIDAPIALLLTIAQWVAPGASQR